MSVSQKGMSVGRRKGRFADRADSEQAQGGGALVPPHDLDAERSVLSALLLDPDAFHDVMTEVQAEDFYHPAHALLFRQMVQLHEDPQQTVDLITLKDALVRQKALEQVGGPAQLAQIADFAAGIANVAHHARMVRDKAVKRRLIHTASEIVALGYAEEQESAAQLLEAAESKIFDLSKAQSRSTFQKVEEELHATFDYIENRMNRGDALTGLATGYRALDALTGGLQNGDLVVIAARPSMGKTALALNIARNAAVDDGKKVAIFSLEMMTQSLIQRLLCAEAPVDSTALRKGFLPHADFQRLQRAADKLKRAQIWIDDAGSASILEVKAKTRRLHARVEGGLDLLILDYLQLARGEQRYTRKDLEIAEISQGLKALAKELEIPVIALSQLNRGPEQRDPDKRRPMLGDLRESGAIEQDADVIAFIYRDVVYNHNTEDIRKAEIIIEKQRNGPTGTINLNFEKNFARFDNRTEREDESGVVSDGGHFVGPEDGPPGTPDFGHSDHSDVGEEPVF